MDPASMLAIASTTFQVVGTLAEGNQAAKVGDRNARMLEERSAETSRVYGQREDTLRRRNTETLSASRAAMAQNGVDASTGTALVGYEQMARDAEMDALMLRYEGLLQSRDLTIEANNERYQGKAAKRQSRMSAAGQLLSSAGGYLKSSGFGTKGPGFSGQQSPAPVETRSIPSPRTSYIR